MRNKIRKYFCVLTAMAVMVGGIQEPILLQAQESGLQEDCGLRTQTEGVTVSTRQEFMDALEQRKSPITVAGLITVGQEADTSGSMFPVMFPENTLIQGTAGGEIYFRGPIQLEGDGVYFQDIGLKFESSDTLGSVPQREIFLAGHSLTFDNVNTYLKGASDLGPFGGSEEELLPTVYAGGYFGTDVAANASLTVVNSNSETMFQAIYMGHGAGSDNKIPYQGNAVLNLDGKTVVREKIDTGLNGQAAINIIGEIDQQANASQFYGNENTTLTVCKVSVAEAVVEEIGTIVLKEQACFSPKTENLRNVTLAGGACLDLNGLENVVVSGNFAGEEDSAGKRGILVLNSQGTLTIHGNVSGTTQFQTGHRLFPGVLLKDKSYIYANSGGGPEPDFVLAPASAENGYELRYSGNAWTVYGEPKDSSEIGRIEILSAPSKADLRKIAGKEDDSIPDEDTYFEMNWFDKNGQVYSDSDVIEYMFYEIDYVIVLRTDYWESDDADILDKTDGFLPVSFIVSEEHPGRYYLYTYEEGTAGDYTFLFCSEYYEEAPITVADVKELKDTVMAQHRIVFYDQDTEAPEESERPGESESSEKPEESESSEKPGESESSEKPEESESSEKPGESESSERPGESESSEKPEESESSEKPGESESSERPGESESSEKPEESESSEKPEESESSEKPEGSESSEKPEESESSEKPGESESSERPEESEEPEVHHHTYQVSMTKEPTCTENGIRTYRCGCGEQYTEEISAFLHRYIEERIPATVQKDGKVQQRCSICADVKDVENIASPQKLVCDKTDFIYDGKVKTPSVTVTDSNGKILKEKVDYQVSYAGGRKNPGIYTITVTLCGNYSGTMESAFTIRPKGVSLKKATAKSKAMQLTWKKQTAQIDGYQIQYAANKNFKGKTAKLTTAKKNATGKKISKLKGKKEYYVRIRTYKTVKANGKKTTLYSDWSAKKTVRTKK